MSIEIRLAYQDTEQVKKLFTEYTDMLIDTDRDFQDFLKLQNYAGELDNLEQKYGLPDGRLYIAICDNELAGCIALRRLDKRHCEMKRLYVRPQYRGRKIAQSLIKTLINDAIGIGYDNMVLDTLPVLRDAISIYKMFGFKEIPPYNDSPIKGAVFLGLDLYEMQNSGT